MESTRRVRCLVRHREKTDVFLEHEDVATGTKSRDKSGEPLHGSYIEG